jgi:hypothetical protein
LRITVGQCADNLRLLAALKRILGRSHREIQTISSLLHPGIVTVDDAGVLDAPP